MRYLWHHIFTILDEYRNEAPLHHYLKIYYKNTPKLGSRDRRAISDAVYAWYRCSRAFEPAIPSREALVMACLFLCGLRPKAFQSQFPESWQREDAGRLDDRIAQLSADSYAVHTDHLFPYSIALSEGITKAEWIASLTRLPRLFLRIRRHAAKVGRVLEHAAVPYEWITPNCLALPNGSAAEQLIFPDAYVVQDASSQATGDFFKPAPEEQWWDCCSGAGGKSLLLKDLQPAVRLLSTDIRESILHNLRQRFIQYGYPSPSTAVLDTADREAVAKRMGSRLFDGIICDVPCTGSGTWARTPESLYFFKPETLDSYAHRGEAILRNAVDYLKPGGKLVYITCSVFRAENEAVVERVVANHGLHLASMQLINGIGRQADCLFVAVLEKGV